MNVVLNDDIFGRNLFILRTRQGIPAQQLADHLHVDLPFLLAIEHGTQRELSIDLMVAAGSYFHVSLADLLSGPIL